jgi:O-antigen/teichoic acid export membrane protein
MPTFEQQLAMNAESLGEEVVAGMSEESSDSKVPEVESSDSSKFQRLIEKLKDGEVRDVFATFLTTLSVFGIFLIQGIVIARILGPAGRGEFGTAMFFPRDVLLYAGLLGGIEIVNTYAVKVSSQRSLVRLKYSAAKLGLISGTITAFVAAAIAIVVMVSVGKTYLIPFCLLCCIFVPWEHMQLTISAVDRGNRDFGFYNVNRLIYAASFVVLVGIVYGTGLAAAMGLSNLLLICILFVISRIVGIIPTFRGMDLAEVWAARKSVVGQGPLNAEFGKPKTSSSETSSSETSSSETSSSETNDEEESLGIPNAWTLLKQGRFYALSMLASEMFERLDVFLVVAIATVVESGYYFVAVPAAQLLTVAPNALAVFTFNAGADANRKVTLKTVLSVMGATILLQVVSAFVLALLVPILILTFFDKPYEPAIPFALWLLPAYAIKGYLQAVDGYLKGRDRPMVGVYARLISIFAMLGFVVAVYSGWIGGFEQKLFCIPVAALIGQTISMVIISTAVILDTLDQQSLEADNVLS